MHHNRPTPAETKDVMAIMRRHVGRANSVTREGLTIATGLSDRTVRACIHAIDCAGEFAIVHRKRGGGYFIADDIREVRSSIALLESRRRSLDDRIRGLERAQYAFACDGGDVAEDMRHAQQLRLGDRPSP